MRQAVAEAAEEAEEEPHVEALAVVENQAVSREAKQSSLSPIVTVNIP